MDLQTIKTGKWSSKTLCCMLSGSRRKLDLSLPDVLLALSSQKYTPKKGRCSSHVFAAQTCCPLIALVLELPLSSAAAELPSGDSVVVWAQIFQEHESCCTLFPVLEDLIVKSWVRSAHTLVRGVQSPGGWFPEAQQRKALCSVCSRLSGVVQDSIPTIPGASSHTEGCETS